MNKLQAACFEFNSCWGGGGGGGGGGMLLQYDFLRVNDYHSTKWIWECRLQNGANYFPLPLRSMAMMTISIFD